MLHCIMKFWPSIDWCPLGEGLECLTLISTLADQIQATACMFDKSGRAWVLSSSNLEIIVGDLRVPPRPGGRLAGWPAGRGVSKNNDREA